MGLSLGLAARTRVGSPGALAGAAVAPPDTSAHTVELPRDARKGENLNVLVITLDTTRRDRLGCYGDREARTPTLDSLAAEGVRFDDAVSAAPITLPSHSTIFTGLYPSRHGVHDNGAGALSGDATTLAEMLSNAGYETAAFVSAFVLHGQFGLKQGFDVYDDQVVRKRDEFNLLVSERNADATTDAALQWLASRTNPRRNYFLWMHYYDPHFAYEPPSPYLELFGADPYRGEIAYMDASIGRLLEGIRQGGEYDHTLIVVLADHGEGRGDHGEESHGYFIYDSTMRIPLIVDHPEARGGRASRSPWHARVNKDPVKAADITPTILDLVGAKVPGGLDGASLSAIVTGHTRASRAGRYGENYDDFRNYGWARQFCWQEARWKYIHGAADELYDLAADPGETHDLAATQPAETTRLRGELERSLARAASSALKPQSSALSPEAEAKLRSLGYLGGSSSAPPDTGLVLLTDDETRRDPRAMLPVFVNHFTPAHGALQEGDFHAAAPHLERVLEADPGNVMAALELTACDFEIGTVASRARARQRLEALVKTHPNVTKALGYLASILKDEGEMAAATELYRRAAALEPATAHWHAALASCLLKQGDTDGALAEDEKALALDPGIADAWVDLAAAREAQGHEDLAADAYRAAIAADSTHKTAIVGLANLYAKYSPIGEALPLYERALPLVDENERPGLLQNLGNAYARLEEFGAALGWYRQALALAPEDPQLHYVIGCALEGAGEIREAEAEWRRALAINPGHEPARERLARYRAPGTLSPR